MWQSIILAALKVWAGINSIINKAQPSEKIQEETFKLKKPRLSGQEMTRIFDKRFHDLRHHPELDITTNVSMICNDLNAEDRAELVSQLTARLNADDIYNRAKSKQSKFRLN